LNAQDGGVDSEKIVMILFIILRIRLSASTALTLNTWSTMYCPASITLTCVSP